MDSIIEDCNSYHISLLKVILILIGKEVDLTKNFKIIDLNDIFNKIPSNEIIVDSSKKDRNEEEEEEEVDDRNIDNKDKVVSKIINNDDEDEEEEDEKV